MKALTKVLTTVAILAIAPVISGCGDDNGYSHSGKRSYKDERNIKMLPDPYAYTCSTSGAPHGTVSGRCDQYGRFHVVQKDPDPRVRDQLRRDPTQSD